MSRAAVALATTFAVLAGASIAGAAQRYAAPGGLGDCTQGAPCSLAKAVSGAGDGDEVILAAGTYAVGSTLAVPGGVEDVHLHGDFGGTRPSVVASVAGVPLFLGIRARLSYLEIANESTSGSVRGAGFRIVR